MRHDLRPCCALVISLLLNPLSVHPVKARCITVLVIMDVVGMVASLECRPTVRVDLLASMLIACRVPGTDGTGPTVLCM